MKAWDWWMKQLRAEALAKHTAKARERATAEKRARDLEWYAALEEAESMARSRRGRDCGIEVLDRECNRISRAIRAAYEKGKETKMQKEYEYKAATRTTIRPAGLVQYKPCATEFGKFSVWYYLENSGDMKTDEQIVAKLVEEKRFGWLDWLAEHTPFVTRTEKKAAYKFTPENLRVEYGEKGVAYVQIRDDGGHWWYVVKFTPGEALAVNNCCEDIPIKLDGLRPVVAEY